MYDNLSVNEKLTVLLARRTFSTGVIDEIRRQLEGDVDWYVVLNACIRNKMLPLAWRNLRDLKLTRRVPPRIGELCAFYAAGTALKNHASLAQFNEVSRALRQGGVRHAPLKGVILVNEIYTMDSRQLNDVDLMISKADIARVRQILNSLGFIEGEYDSDAGIVRPMEREEGLLWKMYMYNLPAFRKPLDSEYLSVAEVDCTFDIRFDAKRSAADAFLSRMQHYAPLNCDALAPEDFLLHLCCHLYKEAKNLFWVERQTDFNLIKFCDVREYVLRVLPYLNIEEFIDTSRQYEVETAVYFTFYYLSQIYADGYETTILRSLPTIEESALYSYGERDLGTGIQISGSFWERFFKTDYLPAERRSTYSSLKQSQRLSETEQ